MKRVLEKELGQKRGDECKLKKGVMTIWKWIWERINYEHIEVWKKIDFSFSKFLANNIGLKFFFKKNVYIYSLIIELWELPC
jgi:hypothetical protein